MVADCPICESVRVSVYNTRPEENSRKRWKKCKSCGAKWITIEKFHRMTLEQGHPTKGNGVTF